jgi:2-C-methyl-D-erythritol 4-phosphate cytidylyltransferase
MNSYVIVVAGGSGERMKSDIPKQFIEIAGKPVLMHTIEKFRLYDNSIEIIVVLPEKLMGYWNGLREKYSFSIPHKTAGGGATRFHSVRNGLELITGAGLVAVHDGVRPLVSIDTIGRCFETAARLGNAIPVISPSDSLRMISGKGNKPLDRTGIKLVQTPQVFHTDLIKKAFLQDYRPEFTDDAMVLERTGECINLVEGNRENIKITAPEDLIIAESLMEATA